MCEGCNYCVYKDLHDTGTCKREKIDKYIFFKPFFKCDRFDRTLFCKDFHPSPICIHLLKTWIDADHYKNQLEAESERYKYIHEHSHVAYRLNGNDNVLYCVRWRDFYNGNLIRPDGKFNAYEKLYYMGTRKNCGYKLIREQIDGVEL